MRKRERRLLDTIEELEKKCNSLDEIAGAYCSMVEVYKEIVVIKYECSHCFGKIVGGAT